MIIINDDFCFDVCFFFAKVEHYYRTRRLTAVCPVKRRNVNAMINAYVLDPFSYILGRPREREREREREERGEKK